MFTTRRLALATRPVVAAHGRRAALPSASRAFSAAVESSTDAGASVEHEAIVEASTRRIMSLFEKYGDSDYIGEVGWGGWRWFGRGWVVGMGWLAGGGDAVGFQWEEGGCEGGVGRAYVL